MPVNNGEFSIALSVTQNRKEYVRNYEEPPKNSGVIHPS
jgi:hypothetical protein